MVDIEIRDVWKSFKLKKGGFVQVLKGVNLYIKDKSFTVILAPSGEGKSTLIRLIAGLDEPDKGEIIINGSVVNGVPPKDRNVGMVFQNYAIYPFMTVFDNIAFPLKIKHYKKEEIEKKVKETAKMLEIDQLLDRKPTQLSGGQKQRVAIARALVKGAEILLLDEPLSNLDAQLRTLARAQIKELQRRLEVTTVYVTHDQVEAMVLADKVAVLHDGIIQDYDDPITVYNKPNNTWVASFIGNPPMNLIEGELNDKTFTSKDLKVKIPDSVIDNIKKKTKKVILGVRPEDVKIGGDITGTVSLVEPLGSQTLIHISIGDQTIKLLNPKLMLVKIGDKLKIDLSSPNMSLFDSETKKNILRE